MRRLSQKGARCQAWRPQFDPWDSERKKTLKVAIWPPPVHHGTHMPSYTRAHTHTAAAFKRTLCLWEQVVEVLKGERGSRKISPGEKAQSLAELQLSALTPAANSRWVHGSLLFDVTLVCSLNWITPVAPAGCCNLLVNDILLSVCCFSLSATCCLFLISQPFKIKTKAFLDHSSDHTEQSSN